MPPCEVIQAPEFTAILCSRGRQRCIVCGAPAPILCDGPPPVRLGVPSRRKTCDAPLCKVHAHEVGPDRHLCPGCARTMNRVSPR